MYAIAKQITSSLFSSFTLLCLFVASTGPSIAEEEPPNISESIEAGLNETSEQTESAEQASADTQASELSQKERVFYETLAKSSPEDQLVWLDIKYPGAASAIQSLALKIKPKAAITHGAALIIPDTSQHADWPGQVRSLRQDLPYGGWLSLSISLPWRQLESSPERELETKDYADYKTSEAIERAIAAGSRSTNQANNDTTDTIEDENNDAETDAVDIDLKEGANPEASILPYQERALVHVQAAMDHLSQQGFQNIALIAIGQSAELAIDYMQSREAEIKEKGLALVLLEPELSYQINSNFSDALGNGFPAPVLDVYRSSSRTQSEDAEERKVAARAGGFQAYQQLKLSNPSTSGSVTFLNKRIKDWLARYAPGEKKR